MPYSSKDIVRTWLFIMVISMTAVVYGWPNEKTFDLRIGFDLTQGENGAPSLKIRNFEDSSELNQRAKEEEADESNENETKPTVRADSSSANSDEGEAKSIPPLKSSKERESSAKSAEDNDSDYSGGEDRLSTRGLKAADYEPEGSRHKRNAFYRRKGKREYKHYY